MASVETGITKADAKRLIDCEAAVERGMKSFVESGNALTAIRDEKLYREKYKTFEAYCEGRWGFEKRYANRLIESSKVVNRIVDKTGPIGPKLYTDLSTTSLPTTESQARELAKAPVEEQAEVWEEVVKTTAVPTAVAIKGVVERRKAAKPKADTPSEPKKPKIHRHDAPMPEWYMDDNRVAVPVELYPVWRSKKEYMKLSQEVPSFELCDQFRELGRSFEHQPTIDFANSLSARLTALCKEIRTAACENQPSVVIDGKWYSKSEVNDG